MHQHKIVTRILLILTILNSVPAAPVIQLREIPKTRGALAVRVPAEGVVAVLEKRPFVPVVEPEISVGSSPDHTGPLSPMTYPVNYGPQSTTNAEHTGPLSTTSPENPGSQPTTNAEHTGAQSMNPESPGSQPPTNAGHTGAQSTNAENPGSQPTTNAEHTGPPSTETGGVDHGAPSQGPRPPPRVSNAAWRQKILTPEKIKAVKYVGGVALLATAYLGLLLPEISNGDGQDSNS